MRLPRAGLVLALQSADVFARQDAEERIHEDALEVMIPQFVARARQGKCGCAD